MNSLKYLLPNNSLTLKTFPSLFIRQYDDARIYICTYLLSTPPNNEALRHSGGDSRRCTSATVTLYFDVELRSDNRPGTEQNTSVGVVLRPIIIIGFPGSILGRIPVEENNTAFIEQNRKLLLTPCQP